jgi:hypothetical protein
MGARGAERGAKRFRLAPFVVFFAAIVDVAVAQDALPRLPRAAFDVIAPSERITGTRGGLTVYQTLCRNGPTSWARRRVVDVAVQEWAFFGMQTIDATKVEDRILPPGLVPDAINPQLPAPRIERQFARVGTPESNNDLDTTIAGYWSSTPDASRILTQQNNAWNAPGGNSVNWVQPWSAAFISWVMCEAGLGEMAQFHRSIAHREYIDQAIRARDGMDAEAAYVAHDAGEAQIEPGDLLCNARASANYRMLADRRSDVGRFAPTHCDIVVKIDERAGRIFVIGGNVEQSVSLTILPLRRDGEAYAKPVDDSIIDGARTVFAHLKLRADRVELNALDNSPTVRALSAPTN